MRLLRAGVAAIALSLLNPTAMAQAPDDEGWPVGEIVLGKYNAGKYAEVIAEAPAALAAEPWNAELRLALANSLQWSGREWEAIAHYRLLLDTELAVEGRLGLANGLAWSGRMREAVPHYQALVYGPKAGEAKLGLANALLWMGRPDRSLPLYNELRAAYPEEETGVEGQLFARRELRARTRLGVTANHDNTPMNRREPFVSHTWRAAENTMIFGLEASGGRDWNDHTRLPRREYGVNFESLGMWLEPRISVSRQTEPRERTFGDLRLQANDLPLYINIGHINWGKFAFTVPALDQGLAANRIGIEGKYQFTVGELRGFVNHFAISDGNRIDAGDLRITSRWRPWYRDLKPFYGVQWRFSHRTDPDYWSPKTYALGYVGLEREWERRYWSVTAIGQVGVKLAGEAATSVSGALIAKHWFGEDWAIGLNAYAQSGSRESGYRAQGVTLFVDKLW